MLVLAVSVGGALRAHARAVTRRPRTTASHTPASLPACLPALAAALALAAQQAEKEGHAGASAEAGPWVLTLDFPSYGPVMTHAKDRCGAVRCAGADG